MDDETPRCVAPEDEWPLPPPWMWACGRCAALYRSMMDIVNTPLPRPGTPLECDGNGSFPAQLFLAQHLAHDHAEDVPDAVVDCRMCGHYEHMAARRGTPYDWLGREHRARHLFAPASIVGLA